MHPSLLVATPLLEECEEDTHTLEMGLGSLPGLSKFQSSMVGVKTLHLETLFISLESYQSLDVDNGFA